MITRPDPPAPSRRAEAWMALALLLGLALSGWRAGLAEARFGAYTDCQGCLVAPVMGQDLWLLAMLAGLFLLARLVRSVWLARLLALPAVMLAGALATDVVVQRLLSRRLLWNDVLNYGGDVSANLSVLAPLLGTVAGVALVGLGLAFVACTGFAVAGAARAASFRAPVVVLLACLGGAWGFGDTGYLNRQAWENVLVLNRPDGMARPYGDTTRAALAATPPLPLACEAGLSRRQSVIVLVVESLSLHHSALFSGLPGLTPELDALAREGAWYPEFYANGFSTEGGLIALLTGAVPIATLERGGTMAFHQVPGDFHRALVGKGYRNRFFTTGTLGYGERERWLRAIGIPEAEGDTHPAYAGLPRGPFNAASDDALLNRVLQWFDHERGDAPFFATVLTVGMHPPYLGRVDGAAGEAAAVRATDAAIGRFVRGLRERGFLREHLLFIVGDHRAMTPVRADEHARFGEAGMVRVPAVVLGDSGLPTGPVPGAFQQTDLLPSLQHRLGEEGCRDALQGQLFGPAPTPADVALVADPMRYDQLRAWVAGREHVLRLDGDDTRWIGAEPSLAFDLRLEVARRRLARDAAPPPVEQVR